MNAKKSRIVASIVVVFLAATSVTSVGQITKSSKNPFNASVGFQRFGDITRIEGAEATAQGRARQARATTGARLVNLPAITTIKFEVPGQVRRYTKPGQPVWLSLDGKIARFVQFPIKVPDTNKAVGRGPGKGRFVVRSKNVQLSNTGIINGEVKVNSEDYMAGFTGAVAVLVEDADGNALTEWLQAGCWGVNLRSGREETWSLRIPEEAALNARTVQLKLFNSPCGRDRWEEALEKAEKAAEIVATFVEVYTKATAGS